MNSTLGSHAFCLTFSHRLWWVLKRIAGLHKATDALKRGCSLDRSAANLCACVAIEMTEISLIPPNPTRLIYFTLSLRWAAAAPDALHFEALCQSRLSLLLMGAALSVCIPLQFIFLSEVSLCAHSTHTPLCTCTRGIVMSSRVNVGIS